MTGSLQQVFVSPKSSSFLGKNKKHTQMVCMGFNLWSA